MPEAADTPTTPAAPEAQANTAATPTADERLTALQAEYEKLSKHKAAMDADLAKLRAAKKEQEDRAAAEKADAEKKAREAGDFAKLHDAEKERRLALEAQLAELSPKAERLTAYEKQLQSKLDAAKAKGDLPGWFVRSLDAAAARNVVEAVDILDEFRAAASVTPAGKTPAPPAPAQGAAPAAAPAPFDLKNPSVADLQKLKASDPAKYAAIVHGQKPSLVQSVQARLTGVGRK